MNKKILYITDTPYRAKSGGGTNCSIHYDTIKSQFKKNMYSIFACESSNMLKDENAVQGFTCTPLEKIEAIINGYPTYLTKKVRKEIWSCININKIDIVYVENSVSGSLIKKIKQTNNHIQVICFFHDIEAILMKSWITQSTLMRKISLKQMIKNEEKTVEYADKKIVLNERDFKLYKKVYNKEPDYIIPISVPINKIQNENNYHIPKHCLNLLFVGADYQPNIDAIKWYLENVYEKVKNKAILTIVGKGMEKYKSLFERDNVTVLGTVDDLTLYYNDTDIVIAPLFSGGGMKIKTAEALSYGKIFIGTSESLTGYWENIPEKIKNKFIFRLNTPKEYIDLLTQLYEESFNKYNNDVFYWMVKCYSAEAITKKYEKIWKDIE